MDAGITLSRSSSEREVIEAVDGSSEQARIDVHCAANVQLRYLERKRRRSGCIFRGPLNQKGDTSGGFDVIVAN